ncbi:hypothetical protein F5878DRAFT_350210 [Lentinula raphanica]|uniref:MYND-type domain-containing protein n=1 Tax=Lentinula raphanica TaxID=153919 RepID=A0AA38U909_9AGAR|nr:hypothetical protein F5878DRAFT_350210 [Lentinula raphanica]
MPRPTVECACQCYICIARSLTPVESLKLVSEGKALFPNKTLARRALAIAPPVGYDIGSCDPSDDMQSALLALASLVADVQSQAQKTPIVQHLFFAENKKDWNLIYPWLDFFADVCLRKMASSGGKSFEFQERVLYIVPLLFLGPLRGHLQHPNLVHEISSLLKSTPKIMKNIFHAWSYASEYAHQSLILHSQTLLLFSDAANAITLRTNHDINVTLFTDAFLLLPFDPIVTFMAFLDQHVSNTMPGILFRVLECLVTSLTSVMFELDLQSFLDVGALESTIIAIERLSAPEMRCSVSRSDQEYYFICISRLHSLIVLVTLQQGVPALAEALDFGWLNAIYLSAYFFEKENQVVHTVEPYLGGPFSDYLANLVSFFSIPSLMHFCVKFTNRMLSQRPDAFEFPGAPKFEAIWKTMIERVNHMESLRRVYKKDSVICANKKCTTTCEQDRFIRVCSRCRSHVYCSYVCQKADWISGHRKECSADKMYTRVNFSLFPCGNNYDTGFFLYVVRYSLYTYSKNIMEDLFIFHKRYPQTVETPAKNKHRTVLLTLQFFGKTQDDDQDDYIYGRNRTQYRSVQDWAFNWRFCYFDNAPKGLRLEADDSFEVCNDDMLYHALFPHFHASGVFNLTSAGSGFVFDSPI